MKMAADRSTWLQQLAAIFEGALGETLGLHPTPVRNADEWSLSKMVLKGHDFSHSAIEPK
jgi:hypothetical protein